MTTQDPPYPRAPFRPPSTSGFLYVGLSVDPPRLPLVRSSRTREDAVGACLAAGAALAERSDVLRTTVFEAVLMPPLEGAPRFDVTMLIETDGPESLGDVGGAAEVGAVGAELVMPAVNPTRIGTTEDPLEGVYLFNHFRADDADTAVRVWEDLAGWYIAKVGVDNSLPLRAVGPSPFPFVNYARLPGRAVPFLLNQLLRPSFHRFVRRRLREHGMTALPVLYRPVR